MEELQTRTADGPTLHVEGVVKTYRRGGSEIVAVDDASLTLRPATMTALVGPSGSGKSTLLNVILGWETADAGSVTVLDGRSRLDWADVAIVPQTLGLLDELSIEENIELPARFGVAVAAVTEVTEQLGLASLVDRFPRETSLGEQQRTSVARAVVSQPRLLVADEPTSHQDEASARRVVAALRSVADAGGTVLIATHDARVVDACDLVLGIDDGRLRPTID